MLILGCHVDAGAGSELLSYLASKVAAHAARWLEVFEFRCSSKVSAGAGTLARSLRMSVLEQAG